MNIFGGDGPAVELQVARGTGIFGHGDGIAIVRSGAGGGVPVRSAETMAEKIVASRAGFLIQNTTGAA